MQGWDAALGCKDQAVGLRCRAGMRAGTLAGMLTFCRAAGQLSTCPARAEDAPRAGRGPAAPCLQSQGSREPWGQAGSASLEGHPAAGKPRLHSRPRKTLQSASKLGSGGRESQEFSLKGEGKKKRKNYFQYFPLCLWPGAALLLTALFIHDRQLINIQAS